MIVGMSLAKAKAQKDYTEHVLETEPLTPYRETLLRRKLDEANSYLAAHCSRCGRTLSDPDSIERGLGPECRKAVA